MDIRPIGNVPQPASAGAERQVTNDPGAPAKPAAAPVVAVAAVQQPGAVPSLEQITQAVRSINKTLQAQSQGLEFSVDSDSNRTIVKVVDGNTKEVIRQIPSEEVIQIAKALDQVQQGLLIRQKA